MSGEKPFTCPKCGHKDSEFHAICPDGCRPFFRDYTDTRMHPLDPDLTGVCTSRFWIWVFLVLMLGGVGISLLLSLGLL
jgi:hypothetical protein